MKKIIQITFIFILVCISFYYSEKAIYISREKDPIMLEIKRKEKLYSLKSVPATTVGNYFIPGINGYEVDINRSYLNMKSNNQFDDSLLVFNEADEYVSLDENYNKFIISGNLYEKDVALVFLINNYNIKKLDGLLNLLNKNNIEATFFVDGKLEEKYLGNLLKIATSNHYIGNLGYNHLYTKKGIKYTNSLIKRLTMEDGLYCYSESDDLDILNICSNNNMHTIKPGIVIDNKTLSLKEKLTNGSIITIKNNDLNILQYCINYIKQKGYSFENIDELINS